ncbi:MAG: class I SAM-dependent methyltransferase [Desulfuromonadaceae bacterium]
MYPYIINLYDAVSKFEQLKKVAGFSEFARAKSTEIVFRDFIKKSKRPCQALEIGPASGFITEYLSSVLPLDGSCSLDLMDFSDGFLENTKEKKFNIREYLAFDITSHQDSFPIQEKYDIIFFQEVLEHLVSPFVALDNINSMLKTGGYLFLTIPNSGHWRRLYLEIFRQTKLTEPKTFLDTHISELSTLGTIKLVTMAGFDVVNIDYYCSRYPFLKSLMSEQVGFLLKKASAPSDRWKELTNKVCER